MRTSDPSTKTESDNKNYSNIMVLTGAILRSAQTIMPEGMKEELMMQLETADQIEAAPAGAILMGVYIMDYLGFTRYIDDLIGVEHII